MQENDALQFSKINVVLSMTLSPFGNHEKGALNHNSLPEYRIDWKSAEQEGRSHAKKQVSTAGAILDMPFVDSISMSNYTEDTLEDYHAARQVQTLSYLLGFLYIALANQKEGVTVRGFDPRDTDLLREFSDGISTEGEIELPQVFIPATIAVYDAVVARRDSLLS